MPKVGSGELLMISGVLKMKRAENGVQSECPGRGEGLILALDFLRRNQKVRDLGCKGVKNLVRHGKSPTIFVDFR